MKLFLSIFLIFCWFQMNKQVKSFESNCAWGRHFCRQLRRVIYCICWLLFYKAVIGNHQNLCNKLTLMTWWMEEHCKQWTNFLSTSNFRFKDLFPDISSRSYYAVCLFKVSTMRSTAPTMQMSCSDRHRRAVSGQLLIKFPGNEPSQAAETRMDTTFLIKLPSGIR